MIKIYYPSPPRINREFMLIKQGLENNARIELVDNEEESDFVFYFYHIRKKGHPILKAERKEYPPDKTIIIDYHDNPHWLFTIASLEEKPKCLAYFKRSWVEMVEKINHTTKRAISWPSNFYPLTFAIMDEFIVTEDMERDVLLSCTVRPNPRNINRQRILDFLNWMNIQGKTQIGQFTRGSMKRFNAPDMIEYFKLLKRSRIVITCNPGQWEGDHRTWETLANGALVFIDKMYTPMIHPLVDGKHCIFYEFSDQGLEELQKKILYFMKEIDHAEEIAKAGHDFAMKYHRTSNRIDEILDVIT